MIGSAASRQGTGNRALIFRKRFLRILFPFFLLQKSGVSGTIIICLDYGRFDRLFRGAVPGCKEIEREWIKNREKHAVTRRIWP